DPTSGAALWVLQLQAGRFTALDSTCPHQGCAVNFVSAGDGFACPCHNSTFDPSGAVTNGPATRNLTPVAVKDVSGKITRG
nr:Rieske (2Fe-2S) protein [Actinomycetota bacterium]